jgi:hypothetical protein
VCERRDPPGGGKGSYDLRDVRPASRHERRATATKQAIERVTTVDGVASSHERVGNSRPADAAAAVARNRPQQSLDIDRAAE